MAGSLNKVMLIGHLGADPEIRSLTSGDRVANLRLATSESWKDKSTGEKKEKTEWHRIVVFNDGLVKVLEQYAHKGDKLYVEGQIQTRKWSDQAGVEKYSTEIVLQKFNGAITLLGAKGSSEGGASGGGGDAAQGRGFDENKPREEFSADFDDTIPFASAWSLR